LDKLSDLQELVRTGFTDWEQHGDVRAVYKDDLVLFNYKPAAQFVARWNWFERVSRGLILNTVTGAVVARPFDRFFNWGERGLTTSARLIEVTTKLDGSLGIGYYNDGWKIATRGSFDGEQATWATEHLRKRHGTFEDFPQKYTPLFEIIYPNNRIVINYDTLEELVLLAVRHKESGAYLPFTELEIVASQYGFMLPQICQINTNDCLNMAKTIDANQEGWVLLFSDGSRFKIKGDRYKEVHRLVSNATFKRVLESVANDTYDEMIANIPDEFLAQIKQWHNEIEEKVKQITQCVELVFESAPRATRKEFAQWVIYHHPELKSYLFCRLDDKDFRQVILKKEF
jgi:RNA ligase